MNKTSPIAIRPLQHSRDLAASLGWRDGVMLSGIVLGIGIVFYISAAMAGAFVWAPYIPLGIAVCILGGWLMLAAMYGSPIAIMIYFAALSFLIDAQFRVRAAGDVTADWQSGLKFLIWLGAGAIGIVHMPPLRTLLSRPGCALSLAYIVVALTSTIYSPLQGYTFGCALALFCLFAFSFSLTTFLTETQILWTLLLSLTAFNIGGWFAFYAIPDLGAMPTLTSSGIFTRMGGLAGQPTNLGALCTSGICAAFVLWYTGRCRAISAVIFGGFAFATLVKSDARTDEIAVVAAIGLIVAARSVWLFAGGLLATVLGLVLMQTVPAVASLLGSQISRSGDPAELATLTGRLQIWQFAWEQIKLSPILGWGYNSTKLVLGSHIGFMDGLMVDSAHSFYLQNLLSVGIVGMIPLMGLLFYLAYRCCRNPIPFVMFNLIVVVASSVTDTDSIGQTPTLMTLTFFMAAVWPGLEAAPAQQAIPVRGTYLSLRTS